MTSTQTVNRESRDDAATTAAESGQYLSFLLAGEEYGVDILKVQEIRGWTPVTRIPNTEPWVQGVLNLRGAVVPIVDLRVRFGLPKLDYTQTTVVVVLAVTAPGGARRVLGVVVDGVSDVLNVAPELVKPSPDFGAVIRSEFIHGMAAVGERMVILLDSDKLLTAEELRSLEGTSH
jgi:purine-binding chemotaxis protein CheW